MHVLVNVKQIKTRLDIVALVAAIILINLRTKYNSKRSLLKPKDLTAVASRPKTTASLERTGFPITSQRLRCAAPRRAARTGNLH